MSGLDGLILRPGNASWPSASCSILNSQYTMNRVARMHPAPTSPHCYFFRALIIYGMRPMHWNGKCSMPVTLLGHFIKSAGTCSPSPKDPYLHLHLSLVPSPRDSHHAMIQSIPTGSLPTASLSASPISEIYPPRSQGHTST
jgi:hypothetical protein